MLIMSPAPASDTFDLDPADLDPCLTCSGQVGMETCLDCEGTGEFDS